MRHKRLQRLLKLISLLQTEKKRNPDQLAELLGISRRSLFRDLNVLESAGISCRFNSEKGHYEIQKGLFISPPNLELSEALAIMLSVEAAYRCGLQPLAEEALAGIMKLEAVLPTAVQHHCNGILNRIVFHRSTRRTRAPKEYFLRVIQALREKHACDVAFQQSGKERRFSSYHIDHLLYRDEAWHITGISASDCEVVSIRMDEISSLEITNETLSETAYAPGVDRRRSVGSRYGTGPVHEVRLTFAPEVAQQISEQKWHETQKTVLQADGCLLFEVRLESLSEITWWILSYGDSVTVESPAALRDKVKSIAGHVVSKY